MLLSMKMLRFSMMGLALLVCLTAVVALTTMPVSVDVIAFLKNFKLIEGHPDASDAVGHAALYGMLTMVIYIVLQRWIGFTPAFWIAVGIGLLLGALTEISQQYTPGRAMVLSDLLGNWLGVMTVAALIGYARSALVKAKS